MYKLYWPEETGHCHLVYNGGIWKQGRSTEKRDAVSALGTGKSAPQKERHLRGSNPGAMF